MAKKVTFRTAGGKLISFTVGSNPKRKTKRKTKRSMSIGSAAGPACKSCKNKISRKTKTRYSRYCYADGSVDVRFGSTKRVVTFRRGKRTPAAKAKQKRILAANRPKGQAALKRLGYMKKGKRRSR